MRAWVFLAVVFAWLSGVGGAQATAPLRVGVCDRPPFAMKDVTGRWNGLAIDVWEQISGAQGLPFNYVEVPLDRMIDELAAGRIDLAVGEMAVSPEPARRVEFSQPYLATPAAAVVLRESRMPQWWGLFREVFSHGVGTVLGILFGALLLFSLMLWLVERRVDRSHFGGHPVRGFGSALWFAAVTMTTVGYGDKTPRSPAGRVVVFFWMFVGVVLVSIFTGAVASSLAVSRVEAQITRATDLARYRTGVLDGSLAQSVLRSLGIRTFAYPTLEAAMADLAAGKITAVADSEASLRYLANRDYPGRIDLDVFASTHLSYALAARPNFSPETLKAINVGLIDLVMQPGWDLRVDRWLGQPMP